MLMRSGLFVFIVMWLLSSSIWQPQKRNIQFPIFLSTLIYHYKIEIKFKSVYLPRKACSCECSRDRVYLRWRKHLVECIQVYIIYFHGKLSECIILKREASILMVKSKARFHWMNWNSMVSISSRILFVIISHELFDCIAWLGWFYVIIGVRSTNENWHGTLVTVCAYFQMVRHQMKITSFHLLK